MISTLIILFFIGYLGIALEHPLKIDKTAIALTLECFSGSSMPSGRSTSPRL